MFRGLHLHSGALNDYKDKTTYLEYVKWHHNYNPMLTYRNQCSGDTNKFYKGLTDWRRGLVTPYDDINLGQVTGCYLMPPSYYPNQRWLIVNGVLW